MDAVKNMRRLEKAMNEELKNIIAYYDGEESGKLAYRFNYTELARTKATQQKAIEDLKAFVKKYNGTANQELNTRSMGIRVVFECE